MKEVLSSTLNRLGLNKLGLKQVTLNQVTMGLAFTLALVAIVLSILIAPRSNEQVIELTPLQPAQELQASINPNQTGTNLAASTEVRNPASLEGQTSAVESTGAESTGVESTLQELPVAEQAADSSVTVPSKTEPLASSGSSEPMAAEQAASSSTAPGAIPTRSTEKISESPYLEQIAASKASTSPTASTPSSSIRSPSMTSGNTKIARPRGATRSEVAVRTVARSSLPLRRDAGSVSVQAGAFKSLENAQKLTSRLQAAGIRAGVEKGKTMYRVLVGPYSSEADARAAARGVLPLAQ
jgi:cell division protein FtsN